MKDCKCSVCGKEWNYSGWESLYYFGVSETPGFMAENLICGECWKRIFNESDFCFKGYAPAFVSGASLKLVKCKSEEELIELLKRDALNRYVCCISDDNITIVDVCTDKKQWFVRGFVKENCISRGKLPLWEDEIIKRYGSL